MGEEKKKGRFRIGRVIRNILLGSVFLMLAGAVTGYAFFVRPEYEKLKVLAYDKLSSENIQDMTKLSDTVVYDYAGEELGLINAGHYVYVDITEISKNLQDAYIAQEDRNFKIHNGIDYKATLRAAIALLQNQGKITQGGSTITQQLVKNTYLTSEQTFTRKFVEMILARELEKRYAKADIMEMYCNINFYGNNCYGVEAASQYYFAKSAKELTVPEAAILVGISNAPSRYEPIRHEEACLEKRNQVLLSMLECGYIEEAEYTEYCESGLGVTKNIQAETDEDYLSAYAFHEAVLRLMESNGFSFVYDWKTEEEEEAYRDSYNEAYELYSKELRSGGYRIYTSLNPEIQEKVQHQLDEGLSEFTELSENGKYALQGAVAVVDNQTGLVVAMVGGRGTEDQYNRAFLSARQPGSAIKPLLDYGPAIDSGRYSPGTLVNDVQFEDGPSNAGSHYHGYVPLREAVNRSLNTVAWQVLSDVGLETGLGYLSRMKMHRLSWMDHTAPAISIGGFTYGATPESMARGYATLARGGKYSLDSCIIRIEHEKEGVLTVGDGAGSIQVYKADTAYMMTDILKDCIRKPYGTGRNMALSGAVPCAGKTGTTNNAKDTWFVGYTRYYTMAVWVGYDTPREMPGVYGATYAGRIWKHAMDELHEELPILDWEQPDTVQSVTDQETGITDLVSQRMPEPMAALGELPEGFVPFTEEESMEETLAESSEEESVSETSEEGSSQAETETLATVAPKPTEQGEETEDTSGGPGAPGQENGAAETTVPETSPIETTAEETLPASTEAENAEEETRAPETTVPETLPASTEAETTAPVTTTAAETTTVPETTATAAPTTAAPTTAAETTTAGQTETSSSRRFLPQVEASMQAAQNQQ